MITGEKVGTVERGQVGGERGEDGHIWPRTLSLMVVFVSGVPGVQYLVGVGWRFSKHPNRV